MKVSMDSEANISGVSCVFETGMELDWIFEAFYIYI